jgi:hypothetical protein
MSATLEDFIQAKRSFGTSVCQRISENIAKLGFSVQTRIVLPSYDAVQFSLVTDPYSQAQDLVGYWYDSKQQRIGQIQFLGDGSVYAEYDIVQPHPSKKQFFVEAINAWGSQDNIKTEAKLLAMP